MLRAQISNLRKLGQNLVDRLPQNVRQTVSNQLRRLVNKEARDNLVAQLKTHAQNGSSVIGSYLSVLTRLNIVEIDFLRLFTTLHSLNLVSGLELNEVVGKVEDLRQQRSQAQKEVTPESADLHSQQLAKEVVEVVSEADILETISVEEDVPRELELSSREKAEIGKLAQRAIDESATRIRGEKAAAHSRMLDVFETEAVGRVRASMGELNNLSGLARDLQVVLANRGEEVEISALMREASSSPDTFALRILRNVEGVIARLTSEPNLVPLKMVSDLRELLLERTVLVTVYSSSDKELLESFIWEQYGVEHITPRYLLNYATEFSLDLAGRYDAQYPGLRQGLVAKLISLKGDEVAINLSTNQGRTLETMMPAVADYLRQQRDIGRDIANFTVDSSPLPIEKPLSAENREKAINGIQALLDQVPNLQWVPLHNFLSTQHTPFAVRIGSTRVKAEYLLDNVVGLARELDSRGEEDPQAKMLYFNDHGLLARILEQRAYYQTENFLDQEAQVTSGQEEVA